MNKFITSLLLTTALTFGGDSFFQQEDKQAHMAITALAGSLGTLYCKSQLELSSTESFFCGVGTALVIGIAKESYDQHSYGGWDNEDLKADLIGGVVGSLGMVTLVRFSSGKW